MIGAGWQAGNASRSDFAERAATCAFEQEHFHGERFGDRDRIIVKRCHELEAAGIQNHRIGDYAAGNRIGAGEGGSAVGGMDDVAPCGKADFKVTVGGFVNELKLFASLFAEDAPGEAVIDGGTALKQLADDVKNAFAHLALRCRGDCAGGGGVAGGGGGLSGGFAGQEAGKRAFGAAGRQGFTDGVRLWNGRCVCGDDCDAAQHEGDAKNLGQGELADGSKPHSEPSTSERGQMAA